VLGVLLIGGIVAAILLLGGDEEQPTAPTVQQVAVPQLVGQQQAAAEAALEDAGLVVGDITPQVTDDEARVGTVLESDPASGAEVDEGTEVDLVVGAAPDTVAVPNVVGLTEDRARSTLDGAGFGNISSREVESLQAAGTVVAVDPGEGEQVSPSQTVTLDISSGTITMPEVTGQQADAATQALADVGLTNVATEEEDSDQPAGTVLGSDPAAGNQVGASTRITLRVSAGVTTVAVPDVIGLTEPAARNALRNAGFQNIVTQPTENDGSVAEGEVVNTNPEPGTETTPDTQIVLLIAGPPGEGG
jgi:serine/threonine-protein kinase